MPFIPLGPGSAGQITGNGSGAGTAILDVILVLMAMTIVALFVVGYRRKWKWCAWMHKGMAGRTRPISSIIGVAPLATQGLRTSTDVELREGDATGYQAPVVPPTPTNIPEDPASPDPSTTPASGGGATRNAGAAARAKKANAKPKRTSTESMSAPLSISDAAAAPDMTSMEPLSIANINAKVVTQAEVALPEAAPAESETLNEGGDPLGGDVSHV